MPPGTYDVVISLPLHATAARPTRGMSASANAPNVTLTFHLVIDAKGNMAMDPRQRPTVTGAPSREPTE